MHFVYKLDRLLQSVRVLEENSYVTKTFLFLTYFISKLIVHLICTIQSHILKFQHILTSFVIFHAFDDFFALNDPKIEKTLQMNFKNIETWHGIIISPT